MQPRTYKVWGGRRERERVVAPIRVSANDSFPPTYTQHTYHNRKNKERTESSLMSGRRETGAAGWAGGRRNYLVVSPLVRPAPSL